MKFNITPSSKKAFIYALIYISFSTIYLYSLYAKDPFYIPGLSDSIVYLILLLFTMPGQLLSWGIRYGGTDSELLEYTLVGISQCINLFIWWKIFMSFTKEKPKT